MAKIPGEVHALSQLDFDFVRISGKSEENVKVKVIVPVFQALGYGLLRDMDFEVSVPTGGSADIVLLKGGRRVAVVETKEIDQNLDLHVEQALGYGVALGLEWVFLSNGLETRLYHVKTWDATVVSFMLRDFSRRYDELRRLLHRDTMPEAPALRHRMEDLAVREPPTGVKEQQETLQLMQEMKEALLGIQREGRAAFTEKPMTDSGVYWSCTRSGQRRSFLSLRAPRKAPLEVYLYKQAYVGRMSQDDTRENIRLLPGIIRTSAAEEGHIKFHIETRDGVQAFLKFCQDKLL